MKKIALTAAACAILFMGVASAQELVPDTVVTMKAKVLSVESSEYKEVPGTNVKSTYQTLSVMVLDGPEKGKPVRVENDFLALRAGDVFFLTHRTNSVDGTDTYTVSEPYRLPAVLLFGAIFVLSALVFGGKQGARGLLALLLSLGSIAFILLPGITHGYPPVLLALIVASLIVLVGSYVTHGLNRSTTTAALGMVGTVLITSVLAYAAIHVANLSGFTDETAVYLNLNTRGTLDFQGLLLAAMIIGFLGVLYDAAIGQSVAVDELTRIAPHVPRHSIYLRALRIGREHIGALVNTLAIAYVAAALPLMLLFYTSSREGLEVIANREIFSTEIVRALIGSIGLILSVPITTAIAVFMLVKPRQGSEEEVAKEKAQMEQAHTHPHSH